MNTSDKNPEEFEYRNRFDDIIKKYMELDHFMKHINVTLIKVSQVTQSIANAMEQIDEDMKTIHVTFTGMHNRLERLEKRQ